MKKYEFVEFIWYAENGRNYIHYDSGIEIFTKFANFDEHLRYFSKLGYRIIYIEKIDGGYQAYMQKEIE